MKRREFLSTAKSTLLCITAAPIFLIPGTAQGQQGTKLRGNKKYKIEIEIFEAEASCMREIKGNKYEYPKDWEDICPGLRGSMTRHIETLAAGKSFYWTYAGTPYEKIIHENGITTEFVRCPDPTVRVVAKIIRTRVW